MRDEGCGWDNVQYPQYESKLVRSGLIAVVASAAHGVCCPKAEAFMIFGPSRFVKHAAS